MKEWKAWAIHTRSREGHGYIGKFWWFGEGYSAIPLHMEGSRVALFTTRKAAREALKDVRGAFPRARVERVTVTVKSNAK